MACEKLTYLANETLRIKDVLLKVKMRFIKSDQKVSQEYTYYAYSSQLPVSWEPAHPLGKGRYLGTALCYSSGRNLHATGDITSIEVIQKGTIAELTPTSKFLLSIVDIKRAVDLEQFTSATLVKMEREKLKATADAMRKEKEGKEAKRRKSYEENLKKQIELAEVKLEELVEQLTRLQEAKDALSNQTPTSDF